MAWTTPKTDWTTGELVTAVPNIKTFLDFAIAVISTWQGNSWGIINSRSAGIRTNRLQGRGAAESAGQLFQPDKQISSATVLFAVLVY